MFKLTMLPFHDHQLAHCEHTESLERDDIVDRLYIMRQQEQTSYSCTDYLAEDNLLSKDTLKQIGKGKSRSTLNGRENSGIVGGVDAYCREQIVEWSFRVADYFRTNRECVAVSISHLDRFLSTCACDRRTFKLAATTCLYLAVKMNELPNIKPDMLSVLSDLSRGEFHTDHIIEMESILLESLAWLIHPPTPSCFVGHILRLLENDLQLETFTRNSSNIIKSLSALASFFTELALSDYYFTTEHSSIIAIAAIANAMEILNYEEVTPDCVSVGKFFDDLATILFVNLSSSRVIMARKQLWKVYERSEEYAMHDKQYDISHKTSKSRGSYKCARKSARHVNNVSPVCVSRKA